METSGKINREQETDAAAATAGTRRRSRGFSVMTIAGDLLTTLMPRVRHPDSPTFRALTRETAAYGPGFEDYRPYRAEHEHPARTATLERAEIVFRRVMAIEAERIAEISRFLEARDLTVKPTPESWNAIGDWLEFAIEGSREPGSDRHAPYLRDHDGPAPRVLHGESTTQLRPLLNSLAFDLSLLLGRHMIHSATLAGRPGGRWTRFAEDGISALPEIVFNDYSWFYSPFADMDIFLHAALLMRLGLMPREPLFLGDMLRRVQDGPPPAVEAVDPGLEFADHLRQAIKDENGAVPSRADIGSMLAEHALDDLPPLPPDLAAKVNGAAATNSGAAEGPDDGKR